MSQAIHLVSNSIPGYMHSDGKFKASLGHKLFGGTNVLLKTSPIYHPRTVSIKCNNHRRNPDFSRHQKGSSKDKNHRHQQNPDETDPLPSKNGSLLSLPSKQRYSATSTPGRREKEIVELFRKVQAQLRERAAIKEEKKIEGSQQGQQGERGTVDSLLKLLRKHSVAHTNKKSGREVYNLDESKKSTPEEEFNLDEPERSDSFGEEPNSNFFTSSNITTSDEVTFRRPASNFKRRSPVPRVNFQPVFSSYSVKSEGMKKGGDTKPEPEHATTFEEFEEPVEESSDEHSDFNDCDETNEEKELLGASAADVSDLASLKLSELKDLAKSRGLKGYSKLKKGELVELLNGDCS